MLLKKFTYGLLLFFATVSTVSAQQKKDTLKQGKQLDIISAQRYNFQKLDSGTQFISLVGNVQVRQEKTLFYADSAVLNQKLNTLEAFGHVHINDADSVHTYADYLKYYGKEKKAYLNKNVKLTDGKGVLTTTDLDYDMNTKIGTYLKGGKVVNGKTILTSKEGYYYGETRDIIFKRNVVLKDPGYDITTDTLLYNTFNDVVTFVSPTKIITGGRKIKTREGWYNLKKKKAYFGSRPEMEDSTGTIKADKVGFDDSTGRAEFDGSVVYKGKDTANGYDLIANHLETDNKKGSFRATQNPLLIIKQNRDSIFVRADTLYSARFSDLVKCGRPAGQSSLTKQRCLPSRSFATGSSGFLLKAARNGSDPSLDFFLSKYSSVLALAVSARTRASFCSGLCCAWTSVIPTCSAR